MASSAIAHVTGNLGGDPETKLTQSGTNYMTFSVATSRKRGGDERTTWWRVSVFGRQADGLETLAQRGLLAKGAAVSVYGAVEASEWTDKSGNARTSLEITADGVTFISAPKGADAGTAREQFRSAGYAPDEGPADLSGVPF